MEKVNLEQGSQEWLDYRTNMFNASEAGAVMRCVPNSWKVRNQAELFELKKGNRVVEVNEAMIRGNDLEPVARDHFNTLIGKEFLPAVYKKGRYSASLDGITGDESEILEIKCPMYRGVTKWIDTDESLIDIAPYYFWQVVHQMYVCHKAQMIHFFVFDGLEGIYLQSYSRDFLAPYFDPLISAWEMFANYFDRDAKPPKGFDPTDNAFEMYAETYLLALEDLDRQKSLVNELRDDLIRNYGEIHAKGIKISKQTRKGAVNYAHEDIKKALSGLDLDDYRKKATTSWVIRRD